MNTSLLIDHALKGALVGSTAGMITLYTYGNSSAEIMGKYMNVPLYTSIGLGVVSIISDVVTDNVFPHIVPEDKFTEPMSATVQLGAMGLGALGLHRLASEAAIENRGLYNIIGLATASEIIGNYVYHNYVAPLVKN